MAELGIIEGYYGAPWSFEARARVVAALKPHGYSFFIYAPKADAFLRKRWREEHPAALAASLRTFSAGCRAQGVHFGVGLSPFEIYRAFDEEARAALAAKLAALDTLGLDILAILFDDMRGDLPRLAETQAEIVHWAAARTHAKHIIVCPSYYTDDIVLDRFFGQRPENYLQDLGRMLDPAIDMFWTGEEVCSREYGAGHLMAVGEAMRRKPFLWDNYPVNDGPRMSQYLYLRAFTGRPAAIRAHLNGHAVNPALQPTLSLIPAITLAESYRLGTTYAYGAAFEAAAAETMGPDLARRVRKDLILLNDTGLDRLGQAHAKLSERYAAYDNEAAREILAWLNGAYRFTEEIA